MEEPKEVRIKFEDEPAPGCSSDSDDEGVVQLHKDVETLDITGDDIHHGDIKDSSQYQYNILYTVPCCRQ